MKYQFQFAGANVNRRSSQPRKRLRLALLAVAFLLAALAYWQYLHHLMRGRERVAESAVRTVAAAPAVPAVAAPTAQLPPALKKATEDSIAALGNFLAQSVKAAPAAPAQTVSAIPTATATPVSAEPAVKTEVATVATPVPTIVAQPPVPRKPRVHTPQERLLRAGQAAFGNCMDMVTKYPDAYGFGPNDVYSDAKLGDPIPVYTVAEEDRAKYESGQPIKPLLKPSNQWVFPVLMGDRICCMVSVKYTGRDYVPEKGSKSLGVAWNKITERWPASEGYHPCLVINPEIPGYFFTVPELPMQNMTDTVRLFDYSPHLSPADVILASWR